MKTNSFSLHFLIVSHSLSSITDNFIKKETAMQVSSVNFTELFQSSVFGIIPRASSQCKITLKNYFASHDTDFSVLSLQDRSDHYHCNPLSANPTE